jgi:hypothetical protein
MIYMLKVDVLFAAVHAMERITAAGRHRESFVISRTRSRNRNTFPSVPPEIQRTNCGKSIAP